MQSSSKGKGELEASRLSMTVGSWFSLVDVRGAQKFHKGVPQNAQQDWRASFFAKYRE